MHRSNTCPLTIETEDAKLIKQCSVQTKEIHQSQNDGSKRRFVSTFGPLMQGTANEYAAIDITAVYGWVRPIEAPIVATNPLDTRG